MLAARRWRGQLIISHHHPLRLARGQSRNNSPLLARLYRFAPGSFGINLAVREDAIAVARLDPSRVASIPQRAGPGSSLASSPRVRLPGHIQAPRAWLRAADAFVLASDEEGFGQVLIEAMAEGLAVISTDAAGGGVRFVLDQGRAGLLVPPGDHDALARAMRRFGDPALRERYATLARDRVSLFTPGAVGAALLEFLAGLPERSPGRLAISRRAV